MRYETAVRRLRTVAARCEQANGPWSDAPFLTEAYAFGAVLESRDAIDAVQMVFVLNLPTEELTWCAQPQSCVGLANLLGIDKTPVEWCLRPSAWPVANHVIRRPLRVWSLDGPDTAALDALERGEAEHLRVAARTAAEEREQLTTELAASLAHLRRVEKSYWERDWRSANRGFGIYPENHLWDAVSGYLSLLDAIEDAEEH